MKITIARLILIGAFAVLFSVSASAQSKKDDGSTAGKVVKTVVVVVGKTAVFTGKTVLKGTPVALKLTGQTAVISGKALGFIASKTVPVARKLIVTYLKAKLPL